MTNDLAPMNASPAPPAPQPAPPRVWTTLELITWTKNFFEKKGIESPLLEAQLLLAEVLGCARIRLYVDFEKPVPQEQLAKYREFVKRRSETRIPLQYILGHTQFIDLQLKVTPAALIPRPETEILAVWAADRAKAAGEGARVLDLCTGSGCVALYVASKVPGARIAASDLSPQALELARENAAALKLDARVDFYQGDLFGALPSPEPFDLIVANPPYIDPALKDSLQIEVRDHEPALALFAENQGRALAEKILSTCGPWLKPGAWLGLEFGAGQGPALKEHATRTGLFDEMTLHADGAKLPRFIMARRVKG